MSWGALGGGVLRPEGQAGTGTRCGPGGPSLEAGVCGEGREAESGGGEDGCPVPPSGQTHQPPREREADRCGEREAGGEVRGRRGSRQAGRQDEKPPPSLLIPEAPGPQARPVSVVVRAELSPPPGLRTPVASPPGSMLYVQVLPVSPLISQPSCCTHPAPQSPTPSCMPMYMCGVRGGLVAYGF